MLKWRALRCKNKHFALYVLQIKRFCSIMKLDEKLNQKVIPKAPKSEPRAPKSSICLILEGFWRCPFSYDFGSVQKSLSNLEKSKLLMNL